MSSWAKVNAVTQMFLLKTFELLWRSFLFSIAAVWCQMPDFGWFRMFDSLHSQLFNTQLHFQSGSNMLYCQCLASRNLSQDVTRIQCGFLFVYSSVQRVSLRLSTSALLILWILFWIFSPFFDCWFCAGSLRTHYCMPMAEKALWQLRSWMGFHPWAQIGSPCVSALFTIGATLQFANEIVQDSDFRVHTPSCECFLPEQNVNVKALTNHQWRAMTPGQQDKVNWWELPFSRVFFWLILFFFAQTNKYQFWVGIWTKKFAFWSTWENCMNLFLLNPCQTCNVASIPRLTLAHHSRQRFPRYPWRPVARSCNLRSTSWG